MSEESSSKSELHTGDMQQMLLLFFFLDTFGKWVSF